MECFPHGWTLRDEAEKDDSYEFGDTVGTLAWLALKHLSIDLRGKEAAAKDRYGPIGSSVDEGALVMLKDLDMYAALMVPPEDASIGSRLRVNDLLRSLRNALPFTDAERWWFLQEAREMGDVRNESTTCVTLGQCREIHGRELLGRFSAWRREVSEYSDGEGLAQARESLAELSQLFTPHLPLPESYEALRDNS